MLWKPVGSWQQRRTVEGQGRSPLWNRGDIGLSPASRVTTQTNKPPKHYTVTRGQNISFSLNKKRKHTQPHKDPSRTETPDLTRPEGKGRKSRRRMANERYINRLPGLLAIKMIREQISFATRLAHKSTTSMAVTNSSRTQQT